MQMASVFEPFCFASRCAAMRVRGFARLRDDDGQHVRGNDRVAIAEFAAVIHFDRNPGQLLDHELARQRRVPTGSAGDDLDFLERLELLRRDIHLVQKNAAALLADTPERGIADGARLLEDFLEHEVLVAALFRHDRVP